MPIPAALASASAVAGIASTLNSIFGGSSQTNKTQVPAPAAGGMPGQMVNFGMTPPSMGSVLAGPQLPNQNNAAIGQLLAQLGR